MAYTIFPKCSDEVYNIINDSILADYIVRLLNICRKYNRIDDPIAIDECNYSSIKICRVLSDVFEEIVNLFIDSPLKISLGNGSRSGSGKNNMGSAFERTIQKSFDKYMQTGIFDKYLNDSLKFISHRENIVGSGTSIVYTGRVSRPLFISGTSVSIGSESRNGYAADLVGDVIVSHQNGTSFYISAKYGNHVTMFNCGIRKFISKDDIRDRKISNELFESLLTSIGIDIDRFFSQFSNSRVGEVVDSPIVREDIVNMLLFSGIGWGYYMLHDYVGSVEHDFYDYSYIKDNTTIDGVCVRYPKNSSRVTVDLSTKLNRFQIILRSKDGNPVYPSHIMCDASS